MKNIDELINKGIENLSAEERVTAMKILIKKRARSHIASKVFHRSSLTSLNLQERCQLIVDGLGDVIGKSIGEDYKFNFDAVGLYLPKENKDLELIAFSGKEHCLKKIISSDDPVAGYKGHLEHDKSGGIYEEIILPLIADNNYQGTILINNKECGRKISFNEFYDFFYEYSDNAASAVFRSIEHKKLLEEVKKSKRLNHSFQEFAAGIAHDLNGGINVTSSFANFILEALDKPEISSELIRKYASRIVRRSNDMENLVKNLPDFARLQSNYKPEIGIYQLDDGIKNIVDKLILKTTEKNMEFSFDLDPSTREINTDDDLFDRVLDNLISNSIKHGVPNSKIEIKTKRNNGVYLSCLNEGFIPEINRIFEPFYTTLGGRGGTGLGLSIVKGNVELLGGKIKAENIIDKDKTKVCFTVYLPQ